MSKMNMWNFKKVLKKASVNYLIPGVSLEFDGGKIIANSISSDNNTIAFLSLPNEVTEDKSEQYEFNFSDIATNLKPYIDLVKDESVNVKVEENRLVIKDSQKKRFNLFFCTKDFTNHFSGKDSSDKLNFFYDNKMSESLLEKINEIKKVAFRFGKIYFIAEEGKLYVETTDKTNSFCNSVRVEVDDLKDSDLNVSMCFDFKNLSYILSTIDDNITDFSLKCTYIEQSEAGMILFENSDKSEKYFITSKIE